MSSLVSESCLTFDSSSPTIGALSVVSDIPLVLIDIGSIALASDDFLLYDYSSSASSSAVANNINNDFCKIPFTINYPTIPTYTYFLEDTLTIDIPPFTTE